jgi:glycosyltransferase involved in cell wall biosynthesis
MARTPVLAKRLMLYQRTTAEIILSPAAMELHDVQTALDPASQADLDLTVFVSCYNERAYIINTLETLRAALTEIEKFTYEIIVVDDCSSDDSVDLVKAYMAKHPWERILLRRNAVNLGWAQNYLDAAFLGRGRYYRVICGDNSEPKETMVTVFDAIGAADILIPYYATSQGRSAWRLLVSGLYTWLVNMLSGFRLHYYNGLPLHLRYNVLRWHSNTRGFGFQADILCLLLEQGFTYKEIPVTTIERKSGRSTAITFRNLLSVAHTLFDIFIRRIANWIYRRRKQRGFAG